MSLSPLTAPASEAVALGRLRGEWDADGVTTVHLPRDVAERLLAVRGWQPSTSGVAWHSPAGLTYRHVDEALQVALIAENA